MTQKLSANPYIGKAPGHQEKRSTEQQVKFQSNDDRHTVCQDVSGEVKDPHVGTSTLLTSPCPMTFFYFQRSSLH
jgi:hypothetical protein